MSMLHLAARSIDVEAILYQKSYPWMRFKIVFAIDNQVYKATPQFYSNILKFHNNSLKNQNHVIDRIMINTFSIFNLVIMFHSIFRYAAEKNCILIFAHLITLTTFIMFS